MSVLLAGQANYKRDLIMHYRVLQHRFTICSVILKIRLEGYLTRPRRDQSQDRQLMSFTRDGGKDRNIYTPSCY